jgi:lysophospholipase L1-like esterase
MNRHRSRTRIVQALATLLIALEFAGLNTSAQNEVDGRSAPLRIFLIGDSTVRNGKGDGAGGLWGWGDYFAAHFDTNKVRVFNRALGGRSSRTYFTEGLWEKVRTDLRPGDFVLMQFGHNDGGEIAKGDRPRASLKGNGDESKDVVVENTGKAETVHSYGWYLRKYIAEAKAAGASPIVLSPVPRNIWKDDRVVRAKNDYGKWAAEAATASGVPFIDFNELISARYETIGQTNVAKDFFTPADHTHTTKAGAELNAEILAMALKEMKGLPFASVQKPR